jgi:hypothetical protein
MTVPARREAARLLLSLDPPAWSMTHACAVADVAAWLARRVRAQDIPFDVAAVEAAALLHDVDKLPSVGRAAGVRHGDGSAAWLEARGLGELASIVRDHPVTRLGDDADAARLATAPLETRIVAYADKRAGQRLESMDDRFSSWRRRYPVEPGPAVEPPPAIEPPPVEPRPVELPPAVRASRKTAWTEADVAVVMARALDLERGVCAAAGIVPADVRRLRWSRRALLQAEREALS